MEVIVWLVLKGGKCMFDVMKDGQLDLSIDALLCFWIDNFELISVD